MLITNNERKIQKNLKRWVIFLILTAFIIMITNGSAKEVMVQNLNVNFFIFCTSFMWMIMSFSSYKLLHKNNKKNYKTDKIVLIGIILWVVHYLTFATFQRSLVWNLAIVFTINSFSMLIPIILSIIFYKEHFNIKKWFVIALSIASIIMFI